MTHKKSIVKSNAKRKLYKVKGQNIQKSDIFPKRYKKDKKQISLNNLKYLFFLIYKIFCNRSKRLTFHS